MGVVHVCMDVGVGVGVGVGHYAGVEKVWASSHTKYGKIHSRHSDNLRRRFMNSQRGTITN